MGTHETRQNDLEEYVAGLNSEEREELDVASEALEISLLLRRARRVRGLSQKEAAERAGLHQQAVSRLEGARAGSARLDTLRSYLGALGYDLDLGLAPRDPEAESQDEEAAKARATQEVHAAAVAERAESC